MKKRSFYLIILGALILTLGPTAFILWKTGMFMMVTQALGYGFWMAVVGFIVFIILMIVLLQRWVLSGLKPKTLTNGLPAVATVIKSYQDGMSMRIGANQFYSITIEATITNPQGESWPAKIQKMLPVTEVGLFQPGVQFRVQYDPNNREKVVFDTSGSANDSAGQNSAINNFVNNPGAHYTQQDVINAKALVPPEIMQKVQDHTNLLNEIRASGTPSTAEVVRCETVFSDFMPGIHILKITIAVKNTIINDFESDIYLITQATSVPKFGPGHTVYIIYDPKNPRRVSITGSDRPNHNAQI